MLSEIVDVIEVLVFSNREPYASLRTIALLLFLAWIIGRLVSRWFEEKPAGKGGGGGPQQKQEQPKGSGGKQQPKPQQQPKGGGGGGGGAVIKPSFLEGILTGIGAGVGATLAGMGAGLGGVVRGIGGAIGDVGRGRSGGQHYLGGTQAPQATLKQPSNSGAWKGAAVGLGLGLGLGAAAASWARSQAGAARDTARQAWQDWQTARHYSQAPAYSWTVPEDAAETISETFAANGIPHRWEQTPEGALRVVILREDLDAAAGALDMAGLEFNELGTPAPIWPEEGTSSSGWIAPDLDTGELREWQPEDIPSEEGQPTDEAGPVAEIYDPVTGEWVPVAEPAGPESATPWETSPFGDLPSDTWGEPASWPGDAGDAGSGSEIVVWGGE